jgi:hypothetical protein
MVTASTASRSARGTTVIHVLSRPTAQPILEPVEDQFQSVVDSSA